MRELSESAPNGHWLFFRKWMRSPLKVASITPSSSALARAMTDSLPLDEGVVVELGGGTGSITRALLAQGLPPEKIIVIERDKHFCDFLQDRFPGVRVLNGDALFLKSVLQRANIQEPIRAVVSGLPFLSMNSRMQARLLKGTFAITHNQGPFIQFTYSPLSPLKRSVRDRMNVRECCTQQVWNNFPPAKVWSFSCQSYEPSAEIRSE